MSYPHTALDPSRGLGTILVMTYYNKATNAPGVPGFLGLLGVAFIVLKLTGFISWSWWWVLAPIWVPITLLIILTVFLFVMEFIYGRDELM